MSEPLTDEEIRAMVRVIHEAGGEEAIREWWDRLVEEQKRSDQIMRRIGLRPSRR